MELIETHLGVGHHSYLGSMVGEVVLGQNAKVTHTRVLLENDLAQHLSHFAVNQGPYSSYCAHSFSLSGKIIRHDIRIGLHSSGAECKLFGLDIGMDNQHIDNHTVMAHVSPSSASEEIYKGIFAEAATGVFYGRVVVSQGADQTDAKQSSRSLLLSKDANVNTRPELEIYADDVKCKHGATIGQLDDASLFYLRSRGVSLHEAKQMLTLGFAMEILETMANADLRAALEALVKSQLAQAISEGMAV